MNDRKALLDHLAHANATAAVATAAALATGNYVQGAARSPTMVNNEAHVRADEAQAVAEAATEALRAFDAADTPEAAKVRLERAKAIFGAACREAMERAPEVLALDDPAVQAARADMEAERLALEAFGCAA
jgi:hypothetical protein